MLFAIPAAIAAIAAYIPLWNLLSSTRVTFWYPPWTLGGVQSIILIRQIQAIAHDWGASWVIYFATTPDPSPASVKQPAVFFQEVDLVWGSCSLDNHCSVCIGPAYSFMPNIGASGETPFFLTSLGLRAKAEQRPRMAYESSLGNWIPLAEWNEKLYGLVPVPDSTVFDAAHRGPRPAIQTGGPTLNDLD
ncbi:hypothetical protein FRC06_011509 [Ceratobasidium sp. 370]|nr:hypothetical protein FRC06_011509 [Ceratobasidium sp. 370]